MARAFLLECAVKTYDWGKFGCESTVAQLIKSAYNTSIEDGTPYAELWMGTHPSGPSQIPSLDDMPLMDWLTQHPNSLGSNVTRNFKQPGLPFLLKVLSVRKALSIQAHPDKQTAEQLHRDFSDAYPDNNHKPEMAIALTEFHALCGFRPIAEIKVFITELPQLRAVIGSDIAAELMESENDDQILMKSVFTAIITQKSDYFQPLLTDLVNFVRCNSSLSDLCKSVKDLFLDLNFYYPGDIGCFCVFLLNYLVLQPSEAVFLAANEPHAYLEGDCVECMACSDNVVRAGLTPKFKDVNTLCAMLTYQCKLASENMFSPINAADDSLIKVYDPPVPEFAVAKIEASMQDSPLYLEALNSASIAIVIRGEADAHICYKSTDNMNNIALRKGSVLFVACETKVELKITSPKILIFRAFCNA